jgi:hypothetical protein
MIITEEYGKPERKTICLNMIVKNEAHVIEKTLANICEYVPLDYWVISDTGSTDNTVELIETFFRVRNIPGFIDNAEWRDFGYNRTRALEKAHNITDYVFIFDADDCIHGKFVLPPHLSADAYQLKFGQGFVYVRTLLVNNRKRWVYRGVLHEYITCLDPEGEFVEIGGDYFVDSGRSGARNNDPLKYIKDATILENAYTAEMESPTGDKGLAMRYSFYCAQSYMDAGDEHTDKAIEWYKRVLSQNNWYQEKYYSALCIGNMYNSRKNDRMEAIKYWIKTAEYDEERIEGIASAMELLRNMDYHIMVNALYHKYKNYNKAPAGKLFLSEDRYKDVIEYANSISAFYISDKKSGYECCKSILKNAVMPPHLLLNTLSNLGFYRDYILQDDIMNAMALFESVDNVLVYEKDDDIPQSHYEIWEILFNRCRPFITKKLRLVPVQEQSQQQSQQQSQKSWQVHNPSDRKPKLLVSTRHCPRVVLTFTTCKRLDLFRQTVWSIVNTWVDLDAIDYWYCVDDNSSDEDRAAMQAEFQWIDFKWKTVDEKGHRASMNMIWDKLNEMKPKYWIHMEDDFLFYWRGSYVNEPIAMLQMTITRAHNVKQVLYNRNYSETIRDYKIKGHTLIPMVAGYCLHDHRANSEGLPYNNCHYWPHYSFRPGVIDVEALLALGNYDSPNQFFEMDYANKWTAAGYTTGFFNRITNRHIGRLTSERHNKTLPNAYELNTEHQF